MSHHQDCPQRLDGFRAPCLCAPLRACEARVADVIRDRILDYAATLDGKASRSVALTCASLATTAGLR